MNSSKAYLENRRGVSWQCGRRRLVGEKLRRKMANGASGVAACSAAALRLQYETASAAVSGQTGGGRISVWTNQAVGGGVNWRTRSAGGVIIKHSGVAQRARQAACHQRRRKGVKAMGEAKICDGGICVAKIFGGGAQNDAGRQQTWRFQQTYGGSWRQWRARHKQAAYIFSAKANGI